MKKLLLLLLVLVPIGIYLYSARDIFKSNDAIVFIETPEALQKITKVYVFTNKPSVVEYKNGNLYDGDGNPGILVADGMNINPFPKQYRHADVFIIVDGKYFHNSLVIDKEDTNAAYNIELRLFQIDSTYYVSGNVVHNNVTTTYFKGHPMSAFDKNLKITYSR